jgi:PAS domain S-box-containing protein
MNKKDATHRRVSSKHKPSRVALVVQRHTPRTKNKRAQQLTHALLEANQRLLALIVEHSPAAIYLKDAQGRYLLANQPFARLVGRQPLELIGKTDADLFTAEQAQDAASNDQWVLRSHTPLLHEERYILHGEAHTFLTLKFPFYDAHGTTIGSCGIATDITERKRLELALHEAEERYRIATELASDYAYVAYVQDDGSIVGAWATDAFVRVAGYTLEELEARGGWAALVHPDDWPLALARRQALLAGKQDTSTFRIITKSGAVRWLHDQARPVFDATGGRVVRIYGAIRDVTQQKQAEAALQANEERYRSLVNALEEGVVLYAADQRILACNASAERILETSEAALKSGIACRERWQFFNEDGEALPIDALPSALSLQGVVCSRVVIRMRTARGTTTWLSVNSRPLFHFVDGTPQLHAAMISFADITDAKNAEAALRRAEAQYRSLIEQLPAITYIGALDVWSSTIYVSPQLETMLGFSPQEWRDDPTLWLQQVHPDDREAVLAAMRQCQSSGELIPCEYRMYRRDGTVRWIRDFTLLIRDAAGLPLYTQGLLLDITDQKRAIEQAQESDSQYRSMIAVLEEGLLLYDVAHGIVSCNPSAERLLERRAEELLGMSAYDLRWDAVHPDGLPFPGQEHPVIQTLATGKACNNVVMGVAKPSGSYCWLSINSQPLVRADTSQPYAVVVSFTDITEQRQAEQALRASEARYRAVVEDQTDLICRWLPDLTITFVNEAYCRYFGLAREQLIGQSFAPRVFEDDQALVAEYTASLDASCPVRTIEHRVVLPNGEVRWQHWTDRVILDADGQVSEFQAVGKDITERKQAEQSLQQAYAELSALAKQLAHSRNLLRTLFDGLTDVGLALIDQHHTLLVVNQAFANMFATTIDAALEQPWRALCERGKAQALYDSTTRVLRDGESRQLRQHIQYQQQAIVVDAHVLSAPQTDGEGRQCVVHLVDVTERLQLEEIVIESERFAANGRLAATIAHEVNTPLQIIQNWLYLAATKQPANTAQYLTLIQEEITRIGGVLNQLVGVYRPDNERYAAVDLNALLERVLLLTGGTLVKQGIDLQRHLLATLPLVWGRADQITQVLLNVVVNATEAMPHGGSLQVQTSLSVWPSSLGRDAVADERCVLVAISDNGAGIAAAVRERVFEPFVTTKSVGLGLGLAISRKIMRQHNGDITIQSASGQGSCVMIWFPVRSQACEEA